jgi:phage host-nuclease inhibitor protein Gam
MSMARVKAEGFTTREEFEAAVDIIARKEIQRRKLEAERDRRIQDVQAQHNPAIDAVRGEIDTLATKAEAYATEHREELITAGKQGAETPLARYGFRWGNPTLALLSTRWKWEAVIESLKRNGLSAFVRTKEDADKDMLKTQLSEADLAANGMRIRQSETFWVEPKTDET